MNGIFKPKAFVVKSSDVEPQSVAEAFQSSQWKQAMDDEFETL